MGEAAAPRRGQPGGRDSGGELRGVLTAIGYEVLGLAGIDLKGIQKAVAGNRWGVRDNFNAWDLNSVVRELCMTVRI